MLIVEPGTVINQVEVIKSDLVDPKTQLALLSDSITVAPAGPIEKVSGNQTFRVTVASGQKAGRYEGMLELRYKEQPAGKPLTITMTVTLEAVPSVDAEASSKNLTLALTSRSWSFPWDVPPSDRGADHGRGACRGRSPSWACS